MGVGRYAERVGGKPPSPVRLHCPPTEQCLKTNTSPLRAEKKHNNVRIWIEKNELINELAERFKGWEK